MKMKKGRQPKPISKPKSLRQAYRQGTDNEPLTEGGRMHRIANRLGRIVTADIHKADEKLHALKESELNDAIRTSNGVGLQALMVIKASAEIPYQSQSRPDWSVMLKEKDGTRKLQWHASFSFGGTREEELGLTTPLTGEAPIIKIDSTDWSGNEISLPVRNVTIHSESKLNPAGGQDPAMTTIFVNTDLSKTHEDLSGSDELSGSLRLEYDPNGVLSYVGIGKKNTTGFHEQNPADMTIGMSKMLEDLMVSVEGTSELYSGVMASARQNDQF